MNDPKPTGRGQGQERILKSTDGSPVYDTFQAKWLTYYNNDGDMTPLRDKGLPITHDIGRNELPTKKCRRRGNL